MNSDPQINQFRTLVITGADAAHYVLAADLATSFRDNYGTSYELAFLNFSPTEMADELKSKFDTIIDLSGDYHLFDPANGYYAAFIAAKARLPELFPGYGVYCWIDADCWFQGADSLPRILHGADDFDICIHPEYDPHYFQFPTPNPRTLFIYARNEEAPDINLLHRPMFNAGVFAMKNQSKVWPLWRAALDGLRQRHEKGEAIYFSDQIPLHRILHTAGISIFPLRAIDNWQTYACTPLIDRDIKLLRVPTPPNEIIGLVHLAGHTKEMVLTGDTGQPFTLRYSGLSEHFEGRSDLYAEALAAGHVPPAVASHEQEKSLWRKISARWRL